jgi:hypothetical protein
MEWLAKLFYPRSQAHQGRKQLKVLVGVILAGMLTAAVVGLGFYLVNARSFNGGR